MKNYIFLLLIIIPNCILAQDSSTPKINFSGYVEAYFSKDFTHTTSNQKNSFLYNHSSNNQVAINLAFAKANIETKNYRGNLALMTGSYALSNLSSEPTLYQNILEANVGVKISDKNNMWLDVGVMPSHIGFESAISSDCYTLTRSILAENSPYFETGAKLSFANKSNTLTYGLLLLNGWQNIHRRDGFHQPNYGLQINYKPNKKLTVNYSNFIGSIYADSLNITRTYHNIYAIYEPNDNWNFIVGLDVGTQNNNTWFSPVGIVRKKLSTSSKVAFRYELFNDAKEEQIKTQLSKGAIINGVSLNYDYQVNDACLFRCEIRHLSASEYILNNIKNFTSFTTSVAVKL